MSAVCWCVGMFRYKAEYDNDEFTISYDVQSLSIAMAVNMGILPISSLTHVDGTDALFESQDGSTYKTSQVTSDHQPYHFLIIPPLLWL